MTNESLAFEEWVIKKGGDISLMENCNPFAFIAFKGGWQASEARILALLDSSEFLEFMVEKLIYKTSAQDLIETIKQRINKGE
jgi:hypothetical protein